nr:ABC transporter substrate binding protein [uncultured Anaeromusa sp.]
MRCGVGTLCKRILVVAVWFSLLFGSQVSANPVEKHILILHGLSPEFAALEDFNKGLQREFQRHEEYTAFYSYEYLDLGRFNQEGYLEECARHFSVKYANQRLDLIVTEDAVTPFLKDYAQQVFPDVPIVALQRGGNKELLPPINGGVAFQDDLGKNIELILQTRPAVKRIIIVAGASSLERETVENFLSIASQYEERVELVFTDKLSYEALLNEVAEDGEDTAVFFFSWSVDAAGERFVSSQVLKKLGQVAKGPIYTADASLLGEGVIGGYQRDWSAAGEATARVARAVLQGEEYLGEEPLLNTYAFDWRALKKWHINEVHLPVDSVVQYKEYSLWERYAWQLIGGGAIFLEFLLIVLLVLKHSRRRIVVGKLKEINLKLEQQVAESSAALQATAAQLAQLKMLQEETGENAAQVTHELDFAAKTDQLTGIYNRRYILRRIEEELVRFSKEACVFSLALADVDFFKKVNDEYGHEVGDKVLLMVAGMLKSSLRKQDVVARWGGEKFLVLLPETTSEQAQQLIEGVREQIAQTGLWDEERNIQVTVTLGIAAMQKGETIDAVMNYADIALYRGKKNGRNCVIVNNGKMKDF